VCSWLCPAIRINDRIYTGEPLDSLKSIKITVDISNIGAVEALVTVRLFWAKPSLTFKPILLNPITSDPLQFKVPPFTIKTSTEAIWDTAGIPDHVCIVAVAEAADDHAGVL
jgi:hypothetical protein